MTDVEITVEYVNPPRGRAKSGSIKDTAGAYYGIKWPDWEHEFKPGCTYKIRYTQNGQFRNVEQYKLVGANLHKPQSRGGAANDPELAERIFVCGALNAMLGNPNLKPHEMDHVSLVMMVRMCRDAWAATFGGKEKESPPKARSAEHRHPEDDMDDEIPF